MADVSWKGTATCRNQNKTKGATLVPFIRTEDNRESLEHTHDAHAREYRASNPTRYMWYM